MEKTVESEPMVLVIDHALSWLTGLPLGSVQPTALVQRRLAYRERKNDIPED